LADTGHEIGSHTLSHPILTSMSRDERQNEIDGAKRLLEEWTEREASGFCYPNGDYDASVVRQLREVGHVYACTTTPGRNDRRSDRFELHRIDVTPGRVTDADGRFDLLGFRAEISMLHPVLRRWPRFRG
jgi:peptidoglycan/xylan/chitin deacetylase (PgdA/CDA1 family)